MSRNHPDASGGRELKKIIDIAGVEGKPAEEFFEDIQVYVPFTDEQIKHQIITALKFELIKVKEDIEQADLFGIIRNDTAQKRIRATKIVNELRVLEGKEPQPIREDK